MTTDVASEFIPEWTDGDKLRKVRRHLGLSQEEFAERLQVKPSTYMAWESDRNRIKDLKTIARRVKVLSGTPLWWWFDTERPGGGPDGGSTGSAPASDKWSCFDSRGRAVVSATPIGQIRKLRDPRVA